MTEPEITEPAVEFSLTWDGYHIEGKLPGYAAYRVISAAMGPNTIITFPSSMSADDARTVRERFAGRFGGAR